jgi:hypothetical protein
VGVGQVGMIFGRYHQDRGEEEGFIFKVLVDICAVEEILSDKREKLVVIFVISVEMLGFLGTWGSFCDNRVRFQKV